MSYRLGRCPGQQGLRQVLGNQGNLMRNGLLEQTWTRAEMYIYIERPGSLYIYSTRDEGGWHPPSKTAIPPSHPLCHFINEHGIIAISTFSFAHIENIDGEGARTPACLVLV